VIVVRHFVLLLLLACGKTKNDAPAGEPERMPAELVIEEADAGAKMFSASGIPGGVRVETGGSTLCPVKGVKASAQKTGTRELRIDVGQRDKPSSAECWVKGVVTVRGLEPGRWKVVAYGLQMPQHAEVDVAPP
jgi:hypothetical protein